MLRRRIGFPSSDGKTYMKSAIRAKCDPWIADASSATAKPERILRFAKAAFLGRYPAALVGLVIQ